jgi:phage regulatory protein, rha family
MGKVMLNPTFGLYELNGQAFCSSQQVSEEFGKRHDNVLHDIRNLNCSKEFFLLNFQEKTYKSKRAEQPEYLMTKDGFTFLVMGYRGKKAAKFKEAYIKRFNEMEIFIKSLQATKIEFPEFTTAIMEAHEEPKNYHYSNEINMIYRIVLGEDAKGFRESKGIEKGKAIKSYLTLGQIQSIERLQRIDIGLIVVIPDFQERKRILASQHNLKIIKLA